MILKLLALKLMRSGTSQACKSCGYSSSPSIYKINSLEAGCFWFQNVTQETHVRFLPFLFRFVYPSDVLGHDVGCVFLNERLQ